MPLTGDRTNVPAARPARSAGARARGGTAPGWLVDQVAAMTITGVVDAVDAGTLSPWDAAAAERAGKGRVTLLRRLEGLL